MAIANNIIAEVDDLIRALYMVSDHAKRESKKAFRQAAKPLIAEIKSRAPVSNEPHSRYLGGQIAATYYPGNLKRSIKTLAFRRSAAVFVGPKMQFGDSAKGEFRGNKTDGYYAHLLEFEYGLPGNLPQPFIRPGAAAAAPTVLRIARTEIDRAIQSFARQYASTRGR